MDTFKKFIKKDLVQWIGLSLIIAMVVEILNQRSFIKMIVFIFTRPLIFLLGLLITMVIIGIGFMFKKRIFSVSLMAVLILSMAISGFVVLSMRVTPFAFGDFLAIEDGIGVVNKYMPGFGVPLIIIVIVAIIVGLVFLAIKSKKVEPTLPLYKRIIAEVIILFCTLLLNQALHMTGTIESKFRSLPLAYKQYGFTICFTYSIFDNGLSRPGKYDEATMDKMLTSLLERLQKQGYDVDKYLPKPSKPPVVTEPALPTLPPTVSLPVTNTPVPTVAIPTPEPTIEPDKGGTKDKPNIIFVQLESFFDLSMVEGLEFSQDPLPNLHQMMVKYTNGKLNVPVVGAGTCNTGFEVITGFCIDWFGAGEYPYKTILQNSTCESMCYDAKPYGYATHAIHNNTSGFYDRDIVFPKLGFDTFTAIEHMENLVYTETDWAKDSVLIPNIMDALSSTAGPDLVYNISVQGHGSYPTEDILQDKHLSVTGTGRTDTDNQYTYYANQIYEMDLFIKDLTDELEKSGEKSIVVFFGDHLPNLGIDESSMGDSSLYQTPFLIWDNIGLGREEIDLEAFQLYSYVYKKLGMREGLINLTHQAFFNELIEAGGCTMPEVIETDSVYYEYYEMNLHLYEWDLLGNRATYHLWGGSNPYVETDMKFGINEVVVNGVGYNDDVLYVYGDHFTERSVIFINGEAVETEYVSSKLIKTKVVKPENGMELFVAQYRRSDKKILSQSLTKTMNLIVSILLQN